MPPAITPIANDTPNQSAFAIKSTSTPLGVIASMIPFPYVIPSTSQRAVTIAAPTPSCPNPSVTPIQIVITIVSTTPMLSLRINLSSSNSPKIFVNK